jgi:hypothetical protein
VGQSQGLVAPTGEVPAEGVVLSSVSTERRSSPYIGSTSGRPGRVARRTKLRRPDLMILPGALDRRLCLRRRGNRPKHRICRECGTTRNRRCKVSVEEPGRIWMLADENERYCRGCG